MDVPDMGDSSRGSREGGLEDARRVGIDQVDPVPPDQVDETGEVGNDAEDHALEIRCGQRPMTPPVQRDRFDPNPQVAGGLLHGALPGKYGVRLMPGEVEMAKRR